MTPTTTPVRFGLSVTPTADPAELDRARRADELGLDLLAVQDHPYQPTHLELWTYLTALAGLTQRISLMPDVADLALRPPALLAKAATSLDILSSGRVELAVGAGGIPEAIASIGGPLRSPGQSVDATIEAVEIIRRGLDPTGPIVLHGQHHHIGGYRPGPPPRPPIGLWAGAHRPRLLRVSGRLPDGWVSPLNIYVPPDAVPVAQRAIDAGALDAEREPAHIRRIYNVIGTIDGNGGVGLNGSSRQWSKTLAEWHNQLGFDTFIFWPVARPDDQLERFAHEVIPGVHDLLDRPSDQPATATSAEGADAPR